MTRDGLFVATNNASLSYNPRKPFGRALSEHPHVRNVATPPAERPGLPPGSEALSPTSPASSRLEMLLSSKIVRGNVRQRLWEEEQESPWNRRNVAVRTSEPNTDFRAGS